MVRLFILLIIVFAYQTTFLYSQSSVRRATTASPEHETPSEESRGSSPGSNDSDIPRGISVNDLDDDEEATTPYVRTPTEDLFNAIRSKDIKAAEAAIAAGAKLDEKQSGNTPLHLAAFDHLEKLCLSLLEMGAPVDVLNDSESTPLHIATHVGALKVVRAILKKRSLVDVKNKYGETALEIAVRSRNAAIVKALIEADANTRILNNEGLAPAHLAVILGDIETISAFTMYRTGLEVEDAKHGYTPLHIAAAKNLPGIIQLICARGGISPNLLNRDGESPLHVAAQYDSAGAVAELKRVGAHVDLLNENNKMTALHYAAGNGKIDAVSALWGVGADLNAIQPSSRLTALHFAAANGQEPIVEFLLQKGINARATDTRGNTALHLAAEKNLVGIIRTLCRHERSLVDIPNTSGEMPLHIAAANDCGSAITELISFGASTESLSITEQLTPLHIAAIDGRIDSLRALISSKARIDFVQPATGWSALHFAAAEGKIEALRLLVEKGASVDSPTRDGSTALHLAAIKDHRDCVAELLKNKASIAVRNRARRRPVDVATGRSRELILNAFDEQPGRPSWWERLWQ